MSADLRSIYFCGRCQTRSPALLRVSQPGIYLPVCDGPRMQRRDRELEVLRRHNAAGRARSNTAYMAGLPDNAFNALSRSLNSRRNVALSPGIVVKRYRTVGTNRHHREVFTWGRDRIGVGLLGAFRAERDIVFENRPSPYEWMPSKGGHIVVCEEGEELSEVIAANYAFSLDAGTVFNSESGRGSS